jgi:hypothetical protein
VTRRLKVKIRSYVTGTGQTLNNVHDGLGSSDSDAAKAYNHARNGRMESAHAYAARALNLLDREPQP